MLRSHALLKNAGMKVTKARLAVCDILRATQKPLAIQDVLKNLGRQSVNQATVYRILEAFASAGLVRRVDLQHDHAHYELVDSTRDHHHVICTSCARVEDVEVDDEALLRSVLKQSKRFTSMSHHALEFYGLCVQCGKKRS